MLILHAALDGRDLLLWAEASAAPAGAKPRKTKPPAAAIAPHPFCADHAHLTTALESAGLTLSAEATVTGTAVVWLPVAHGRPLPSSPLLDPEPAPAGSATLTPWQVPVLRLNSEAARDLLASAIDKTMLGPGVMVGADLAFWAVALRFAASLVTRQQFLPGLEQQRDAYYARWQPVYVGTDAERLAKLTKAMPDACRAVGADAQAPPANSRDAVLRGFIATTLDALVREAETPPILVKKPGRGRPAPRTGAPRSFDSLHDQWLHALTAADARMAGAAAELAELAAQIQEWQRPISVTTSTPWRLCFRLDEPVVPDDEAPAETAAQAWDLRYLLQARDDLSLQLPLEAAWRQGSVKKPSRGAAQQLLARSGDVREYLLAALGQAAALCPPVEQSLKAPAPAGCELDGTGAHEFLTQHAWQLEQAGFGVFLPSWWTRKGTKLHLAARAKVKSPKLQGGGGLSLEEIVKFEWEVALGGAKLSLRELEALAAMKSPLVHFRGQWVQLNADEIQAALAFWKQRSAPQATVRELMRMALGAETQSGPLPVEGIEATGWIGDLLQQLQGKAEFAPAPPPPGLHATLRPYQERGYSWLRFLRQWGLGACLADDMGLGKTIQFLSLLEASWEAGERRPTLLICPTSVVANWHREAARFTPDLAVVVHHGLGRAKGTEFKKGVTQQALVLSSYALLHRDLEAFKAVEWAGVVLDEAQNIKNPETKQSKAARALKADYRIALTGTPVENNVGDLWSIMEFLNPGLLGSQTQFKKRFFAPIQVERDAEATQRLKQVTGPFILRRLKTDKSVISDLPDKMEMKVFCSLTKEQASLYAAVVEDASKDLDESTGMKRKGLVLATLMKLKQVCNHPAQFLGDNSAITGRSGKLARLTEMMDEVLAAGDSALIFTQFHEMGDIIRRHLQDTFGQEALFLHGGVTKKARDQMVERFQGSDGAPRIFILSLKAGGVGLNLTRASHVFHFDRWWNPAVENQASDRAFRIGQAKNVQVHKFVCAGTLEDKIDEMIERKQSVASSIVGTGEGWLTELSTAELREVFALRAEAMSE